MVVEDSTEYQDAVVWALLTEPSFKEVRVVSSGEEALEKFSEVSPDLVLLDFRLPGINGLETAKRMKVQRPDVKIAVVSGYTEEISKAAAQEANVEKVIPKGKFNVAKLSKLLRD